MEIATSNYTQHVRSTRNPDTFVSGPRLNEIGEVIVGPFGRVLQCLVGLVLIFSHPTSPMTCRRLQFTKKMNTDGKPRMDRRRLQFTKSFWIIYMELMDIAGNRVCLTKKRSCGA